MCSWFKPGGTLQYERRFQQEYYARVRPAIRFAAASLCALLCGTLLISGGAPAPYDLALFVPQIAFWLCIFGLTFSPRLACTWQPIVVSLELLTAVLVLSRFATLLSAELSSGEGVGSAQLNVAQQKFYYVLHLSVLLASLAALRLQLRWAALLYGGVAGIGLWAFLTRLPAASELFLDLRFALLPALLVMFVLLLASGIEEHLARRYFSVSVQLEAERDDEVHQRQLTEGKLKVLGQAIGTIVHDLGNPLTSVQTGASVLQTRLDKDADKESLIKLSGIILDGARMLNFLRLSLMEQTRVLEGLPIPVDLKRESLREIIDAGVRYQKPRNLRGHEISIQDDDRSVFVDQMKMITVFMNLIGNALKYSDGTVQVHWRGVGGNDSHVDAPRQLVVAVLDCGTKGKGITRVQASELFTPFGRMESHSQIEGSGLGLLSVRRIVEAHGGEAYIEGYTDGTNESEPFSTARGTYSPMLHAEYRSAFVITCPMVVAW